MIEPKKDDMMRSDQVADLDPYNMRGKPKHEAARELIGEEPEVEEEQFDGLKFTQEQREKLEEVGLTILQLENLTFDDLYNNGLGKIYETKYFDLIEKMNNDRSIKTEVAINILDPFIKDSFFKTFGEQIELVRLFDEQIRNQIPGVKANIAEAVDLAQISFIHAKESYFYVYNNYTRTSTSIDGKLVAISDQYNSGTSSTFIKTRFDFVDRDSKLPSLGIVALIYPESYPGKSD